MFMSEGEETFLEYIKLYLPLFVKMNRHTRSHLRRSKQNKNQGYSNIQSINYMRKLFERHSLCLACYAQ